MFGANHDPNARRMRRGGIIESFSLRSDAHFRGCRGAALRRLGKGQARKKRHSESRKREGPAAANGPVAQQMTWQTKPWLGENGPVASTTTARCALAGR